MYPFDKLSNIFIEMELLHVEIAFLKSQEFNAVKLFIIQFF